MVLSKNQFYDCYSNTKHMKFASVTYLPQRCGCDCHGGSHLHPPLLGNRSLQINTTTIEFHSCYLNLNSTALVFTSCTWGFQKPYSHVLYCNLLWIFSTKSALKNCSVYATTECGHSCVLLRCN